MLNILLTNDTVKLGSACEFIIIKDDPHLEYQVFLKHENIMYLNPLFDWVSSDKLQLFPEAPGRYQLILKWRSSNNRAGRIEYPFKVIGNIKSIDSPQLVHVDSKTSFWTPNQWEAQMISNYEKTALKQILRQVKSGWTVYDIGANLGYYSIFFSRAIGKNGQVYSFEANPVCIYFLQANLVLNNVQNCDILPAAILDKNETVPFTINYSSSGLGITQKSSFYNSKLGHEIVVQGYDLDHLTSSTALKPPNLVKLDIEGAEEYAIRGMKNILEQNRPILLIEIHGRNAAQQTIPLLEKNGYRFQEMDGREFEHADEFLASFPDKVIQLICLPNPKTSAFF